MLIIIRLIPVARAVQLGREGGEVVAADVENTTLEHLYPKAKAFVMRDVLLEPTHQYSEFSMTPLRLYLVYADLSGVEGNQYELIQSVRFEKAAESTNDNDQFTYTCEQRGVIQPLAAWREHQYAAVSEALSAYADKCLAELKHQKGSLQRAYTLPSKG